MLNPIKTRIMRSILSSGKTVILRQDFERFGQYRRVSRALSQLEAEKVITRADYGIYAKLVPENIVDDKVSEPKGRIGKRGNRLVRLGDVTVHAGSRKKQQN